MVLPSSRPGAPCAVLLAAASLLAQSPDTPPAKAAAPNAPAAEAKPWRLQDRVGGPSWLRISGEQRTRYETLDHEFRFRTPRAGATPPVQGYSDTADMLVLRTSLLLEAKGDTVGGVVELMDSRQYGAGENSFLDSTMVNTLDVLQAYVDLQLGTLGTGKHRLRVGREAVDLGGRRFMARNAFRNTINSFNAIDWLWTGDGQSLRAFWSMPTERRPQSPNPQLSAAAQAPAQDALADNDWEADDQSLDTQFWGVFHDRKLDDRTTAEVFLLGLDEHGTNTRQRSLFTPGLRLFRTRKPGTFHYEAEAAGQLGHSKANTNANSPLLDHRAGFVMGALAYTADVAWQPALQLSWTYASGDQDPNDGDNERFDTLYGARRWEYGPTGIWGAIPRANLNSPEVRLLLQPSKVVDVFFAVRPVWLAEERDAWTSANLRDSSGRSGKHVGTQYEVRLRWDLLPRSFQLDTGAVYLAEGDFQDRASSGQGQSSSYAYVQCTWFF